MDHQTSVLCVLVICILIVALIAIKALVKAIYIEHEVDRKLDLILLGQHGDLTPTERAAIEAAASKLRSSSTALQQAVDANQPK